MSEGSTPASGGDRGARESSRLPPANPLAYAICRRAAAVFFRVFYRPILVHRERMPERGPALIASNHQSFFDPPLVGCWFRKPLTFIARSGLFKSPAIGALIRPLNTIPVAEDGSDTAAMKAAIEALGEGRMVVIFPEGSRTPDGRMQEFKRGVSLLVKRGRCPVVPVGIEGAFDAWPRSRAVPRLFGQRLAVVYGEPISLEELEAEGKGALARIEREIAALRAEAARRLAEAGHRVTAPDSA